MEQNKDPRFEVGEWIVHYYYGVGKVIDIVEKGLENDKKTFYKVYTNSITYWIPIDNEQTDHIKPIRSKAEFNKALKVLAQPPKPIASHHKSRKKRIHDRWLIGTLTSRAKLLRDLYGRLKTEKLSFSEKQMMEKVRNHYIDEWLKSDESLNKKTAKKKIRNALKQSVNKLDNEQA